MLARLRPRLTYANVVSTVCLFIVLGGAAFAATSFIQANGTIRGCVSKKGQLTVLRKGKKKCRKGQTKIAWNQVGKQGAPGQPGAKGDTGPATGPAGGDLQGNYPNPTIKPNVVSGANIDESTLGQVPSAANASQLGGLAPSAFVRTSNIRRFHSQLLESDSDNTSTADLLDLNGFLLLMDCEDSTAPDVQRLRLRVSTGGANPALTTSFVSSGGTSQANDWFVGGVPTAIFDRPVGAAMSEIGTGTMVYHDDTQVISIVFRYTVGYSSRRCEVSGTATSAG